MKQMIRQQTEKPRTMTASTRFAMACAMDNARRGPALSNRDWFNGVGDNTQRLAVLGMLRER